MPDKFHEECAVMGVYGHPEAANMVYLGLYALQHRGQESCGIVSSDGKSLISHRQMGLVGTFRRSDRLLPWVIAVQRFELRRESKVDRAGCDR